MAGHQAQCVRGAPRGSVRVIYPWVGHGGGCCEVAPTGMRGRRPRIELTQHSNVQLASSPVWAAAAVWEGVDGMSDCVGVAWGFSGGV